MSPTQPTPRLPRKRQQNADASGFPVALLMVLLCTLGFFALLLMVFPGLAMLALAGVATFAFFAVQYFIWARWLLPAARKADQARSDDRPTEQW